jgi:hypothetical protein
MMNNMALQLLSHGAMEQWKIAYKILCRENGSVDASISMSDMGMGSDSSLERSPSHILPSDPLLENSATAFDRCPFLKPSSCPEKEIDPSLPTLASPYVKSNIFILMTLLDLPRKVCEHMFHDLWSFHTKAVYGNLGKERYEMWQREKKSCNYLSDLLNMRNPRLESSLLLNYVFFLSFRCGNDLSALSKARNILVDVINDGFRCEDELTAEYTGGSESYKVKMSKDKGKRKAQKIEERKHRVKILQLEVEKLYEKDLKKAKSRSKSPPASFGMICSQSEPSVKNGKKQFESSRGRGRGGRGRGRRVNGREGEVSANVALLLALPPESASKNVDANNLEVQKSDMVFMEEIVGTSTGANVSEELIEEKEKPYVFEGTQPYVLEDESEEMGENLKNEQRDLLDLLKKKEVDYKTSHLSTSAIRKELEMMSCLTSSALSPASISYSKQKSGIKKPKRRFNDVAPFHKALLFDMLGLHFENYILLSFIFHLC